MSNLKFALALFSSTGNRSKEWDKKSERNSWETRKGVKYLKERGIKDESEEQMHEGEVVVDIKFYVFCWIME